MSAASYIHMDDKSGYLHIIMGPMYCGKTNELLNELLRFDIVGAPVLYLNSAFDTRTSEPFSTHHPLVQKTLNVVGKKVSDLYEVYDECLHYDVIGIDEAQFFPRLREFVLDMVENRGKRVIVAGLSGNFKREVFGEVISLIPFADRVQKLNSLCTDCSKQRKIKEAHFSYRIVSASVTDDILVGGKTMYVPLCRACYLEHTQSRRTAFKDKEE